MALVLKDRVKESSSSSGTGNITLGGAFPGYQAFNTAIASGSTVYYTIHNLTAGLDNEWEVGVGTFTSPATLSRDTVLSSSASGSKVNFTSGVSGLEVFVTQPAEQAVYINDATGRVEVFGNGTNVVTFTEINTTNLTANTVTLTAGTISTNAANATDITNKQYVDTLFSQSITYHEPVLVETPTALTATYNQPGGAGNGVGATLTNSGANVALQIDGVSLSNTARVLVRQQANAVQNGVYTVTNPGAPDPGGAQWVLTRSTDTDTFGLADPNKLGAGDAFFVQSGNTGAGQVFECNTLGTITFGTTNISFVQISTAQIYNAGTGLNLSNLTFSIANTAVTAATYGNDGNVAQFTVNAQGQLTNAANVAINASSITVGTLNNARTTASSANGASTIVARDSTGSFTANTITATTSNATTFNGTTGAFTNVSGNGVALTAINASNITSGTLDNARTTGNTANSANTIVLRDASGNFGSNVISASLFSGDGSAINAINASNISSGTIANARTTASSSNEASTIVQRDSGGNFSANTITANISGDISGGTNINASNITSGTIANARTTASSSNGASTIVLRDAGGSFAAGAITGTSFSGNGASITDINASAITTGTIANARTTASSSNGASTIVARDANGAFAAGAITGTSFTGDGSALSSINASNLSSGTVNTARISGSYTGITEVGTLTAGTWNASTIGAQFGGTGSANLTANNVLLGNGASSVQFVAPGTNGNVLTSNGTTWVSQAAGGGFAAGTVLIFAQTNAPTGWTKNTSTGDNSALRVTTGVAGTGGSVAFTTAFASQAVSGTIGSTTATNQATTATNQAITPSGSVNITSVAGSAGATTLSTPQIPSHTHGLSVFLGGSGNFAQTSGGGSPSGTATTGGTGGGGSHTHPFSFSSGSGTFSGNSVTALQNSHNHTQDAHNHTFTGTAINLAVQYIDVIRATKD